MDHVPEALPAWLQALLYIGGVIGAAAAAFHGWIKKAPSQKAAENAAGVLIAGDIMATKPMQDLAEAVSRMAHGLDHMIEAQDRTTAAVDRVSAATDRNEAAVRDLCRAIERTSR